MPAYNPYAYTFNDPINFTDPTGMIPYESNWMYGSNRIYQASGYDTSGMSIGNGSSGGQEDSREITYDESGKPSSVRLGESSGCPPPYNCDDVAEVGAGAASYGNILATTAEHWHFSEPLGTFLTTFSATAPNAHFSIWAGARKYAPVLARARTTANIFGAAGKSLTATSLVLTTAEYTSSARGPWDKFRFAAEASVTLSLAVRPLEVTAIGIGWELGRFITNTNAYKRLIWTRDALLWDRLIDVSSY